MELIPFKMLKSIPKTQEPGGSVEDLYFNEKLFDVAYKLQIENLRATKLPMFTGMSCFKFDGLIKFGFNAEYELIDIEFRQPFVELNNLGLMFRGENLFQLRICDCEEILKSLKINTDKIDVGIHAPELGISLFSNDFDDSTDVKLDALTIHCL